MSLVTNGITPNVICEMMPPYHLSADLLEATFAALPPPPDAPPTWRHARVARLTQEFATLMPANAAQARMVSQILIMRGLADAIAIRAHAPELTALQMGRVGRASAELTRTAAGLARALERSQQKPVPFFGTVLADGVDLAALDAVWGKGARASSAQQAGAEPRQSGAGGETGDAEGLRARPDLTTGTAVAGLGGTVLGAAAWEQNPPATMRERDSATNPTQLSAMPAAATEQRPGGPVGEPTSETTPLRIGGVGPCGPEAGGRRGNPVAARS